MKKILPLLALFVLPVMGATIPTTSIICEMSDATSDNQFEWTIIRGESRYFQVQYQQNGTNANLSDAGSTNAYIYLKASDSTNTYRVDGSITDITNGIVRVLWAATNAPTASVYAAEFAVPDSPEVNLAARGKLTVKNGTGSGVSTNMPYYPNWDAAVTGLSGTQAIHTAAITGLSSTQALNTAGIAGLSSTQSTAVAAISGLSSTQSVAVSSITGLSSTQSIAVAGITGLSQTQANHSVWISAISNAVEPAVSNWSYYVAKNNITFGTNMGVVLPNSVGPAYAIHTATTSFNGQVDHVLNLGYNRGAGTFSTVDAAEPMWNLSLENNYDDGTGNNWMELNLDYVSTLGVQRRPLSILVDTNTDYSVVYLNGDIYFTDHATRTTQLFAFVDGNAYYLRDLTASNFHAMTGAFSNEVTISGTNVMQAISGASNHALYATSAGVASNVTEDVTNAIISLASNSFAHGTLTMGYLVSSNNTNEIVWFGPATKAMTITNIYWFSTVGDATGTLFLANNATVPSAWNTICYTGLAFAAQAVSNAEVSIAVSAGQRIGFMSAPCTNATVGLQW